MLSNKPYLIRAFYEWIVDSACTPYIVINAAFPHCKVPQQFIENNEVTLNVSPEAIRDFKITKDHVEFRASFSGVVHIVSAPIKAVLAIYAQENQQGMFFDYEEADGTEEETTTASQPESSQKASTEKHPFHLRLVE